MRNKQTMIGLIRRGRLVYVWTYYISCSCIDFVLVLSLGNTVEGGESHVVFKFVSSHEFWAILTPFLWRNQAHVVLALFSPLVNVVDLARDFFEVACNMM